MKVRTKLKNHAIINCIVSVLLFIAIFFFLYPDKEKIIQAELVLILISITTYYAFLTRELVKQNREDFEDRKNERLAIHAETKLQEFYVPFSVGLIRLTKIIGELNWQNRSEQLTKAKDCFGDDLVGLSKKYLYLLPKEIALLATSFDLSYRGMRELGENEEEKLYSFKREILKTLETILSNATRGIFESEDKINAIYHVHDPVDRKSVAEMMRIYREAKDE